MTTPGSLPDRRSVLRLALAAGVAVPASSALASCATSGGGGDETSDAGGGAPQDAKNPFGVKKGASGASVIFDGGFGTDYVTFAAKIFQRTHDGKFSVKPSTKIAQELQPRFVGGNPPDLIDNSGANSIGMNGIADQLEDLTSVFEANNLEGTPIKDTLYPGAADPGTIDGKLVGINYAQVVFAIWYSASLFEANGWKPPKTWEEAYDLGAKAKAKKKYLFLWGKEAATYYQTLVLGSAIKEGGDEVRLALDNLEKGCWSQAAVQGAIKGLEKIIKAGYMKPGGGGTQFTAAQAQWSKNQDALLYPSGAWIENEMKDQTKAGFKMTGVPELTVSSSPKMPHTALQSMADETFIVPSDGKNTAAAKEMLRIMLSKEAATNFAKTKLTPTVVKDTVPDDGFGSTALQSQSKMLEAAGKDVFAIRFVDLYGMNQDQLVPWNAFLAGQIDAAGLTKRLQEITDKVRDDSKVKKVKIT